MNRDTEHLNLLSILHYVYAGLIALCSCIPVVYVLMGLVFLTGTAGGRNEHPGMAGGFMTVVGFALFVFTVIMAGLTAYTGRCLSSRKHHTFCIVMAAISCLSFPIGTALGVFTIIVLQRPGVRQLFNQPLSPQS